MEDLSKRYPEFHRFIPGIIPIMVLDMERVYNLVKVKRFQTQDSRSALPEFRERLNGLVQ